jgi:hypothetical protein
VLEFEPFGMYNVFVDLTGLEAYIERSIIVIKAISSILKIIFIICLIIVAILVYGISVDKISTPLFNVEKLYVKLHKGLVLKADKIYIHKTSKNTSSKAEISKLISYIKHIKFLFLEIDLKKVELDNKSFTLKYNKNLFYLDTDYVNISTDLKSAKKSIKADIKNVNIKDFNTTISGALENDFKQNSSKFDGNFSFYDEINGSLNFVRNDLDAKYILKTNKFKNLKSVVNLLEDKNITLSLELKNWLTKKITSQYMQIDEINGSLDFKTLNPKLNNLSAIATIFKPAISFDERLDPIKAKEAKLILKNGSLNIDLVDPTFKSIPINGSSVKIDNIFENDSVITINIQTKSPFNKDIKNITDTYDISIPFIQTSGSTNTNIFIQIKLENTDVVAGGKIGLINANVSILGTDETIFAKKAFINIKENLVYVNNSYLEYKDLLKGFTDGAYDVSREKYIGKVKLNELNIKTNNLNLLNTNELNKTKVVINFNKSPVAKINDYNTTISFGKQKVKINLNDISKLYTASPILKELNATNGSIEVSLENQDMKVFLDKLNLDVTNLDTNGSSMPLAYKKILIRGKENNISYNKHKLNMYNFTYIKTMGFQKLVATKQQNKFTLSIDNNITIKADIKDSKDINELIGEDIFAQGTFNLAMNGKKENIKGKLTFKETTVKGLALYNNLMAFINTIPSLVTFQNPKFSSTGYKIKKGSIDFASLERYLVFNNINIDGYSSDIIGSGYIDFKTKDIRFYLQVSSMDNLTRVVKNIPLAGYLILGKDKKLGLSVKVDGKLDNPKIHTYAIKDTLSTPFRIFRRIFELPFK